MYHQFNIQQLYVMPTQCNCVFCVDLRTNSDYFTIQHGLVGFYNWDGVGLLRGTDWIFVCNPYIRKLASRRSLTAKADVQSKISLCDIFGRQSGPETGFSPSTSVSPVSIIPPMLHTVLHLVPQDQTGESWEPSKKHSSFEKGALDIEVFSASP